MGQRTGAHHEDCMNSITPRVKPNNIKLVFVASVLKTQNCVVRVNTSWLNIQMLVNIFPIIIY